MSEPSAPHLPAPSAAHRRLHAFVGKWRAEGDSYAEGQSAEDPRASAVPLDQRGNLRVAARRLLHTSPLGCDGR